VEIPPRLGTTALHASYDSVHLSKLGMPFPHLIFQHYYIPGCDRKARAASPKSFTLWQQATIEITCRDHSIIACLRHIYMGVILRAHPVRGE